MKVDYKGSSIFYKVSGVGTVLVFLHGFLETSQMWDDLISKLKPDFKCIAVDLLGHGKSEGLSEIHSMEDMAAAVISVLNAENIKEANFIGHSMGGYVALALAEMNPDVFRSICLMNSTALEDDEQRKYNRDRAIEVVRKDKDTFINVSITNLFAKENRLPFQNEIKDIKTEAHKISKRNIIAALGGMKNRNNKVHVLEALNCKKLVVLGSEDEVLNLEKQTEYLNDIKVPFTILKCGHMSYLEEYEEITYIIKHFNEKL